MLSSLPGNVLTAVFSIILTGKGRGEWGRREIVEMRMVGKNVSNPISNPISNPTLQSQRVGVMWVDDCPNQYAV